MKNTNPKIDFPGAHFLKTPSACFLKNWGIMLQGGTQIMRFQGDFAHKSKNGLLSASPQAKNKKTGAHRAQPKKQKKPNLS